MRKRVLAVLAGCVLLGCSSGDPDALEGLTAAERAELPVLDHEGLRELLARHAGKAVVLAGWTARRGEPAELYRGLAALAKPDVERGPVVIAMNLDGTRAIRDEVLPLIRDVPSAIENCVFEGDQMSLLAVVDPEWGGLLPAVWIYDAQGTLKHSLYGEDLLARAGAAVAAMTAPPRPGRR